MKKVFIIGLIAFSYSIGYGQQASTTDLNKLFEQEESDYSNLMSSSNKNSLESYLNKYGNIVGLDSVRSNKIKSNLQDLTEVYENVNWKSMWDIHIYPDKVSPVNFFKIWRENKIIVQEFKKSMELNNPKNWLAFRDIYNSFKYRLITERDSLDNLDQINLRDVESRRDYYLSNIGFKPSLEIYESAKPYIVESSKPLLLEILKSDETKLSLGDIDELATHFFTFNPFSKQNHKEYAYLWLTILKDNSPNTILNLFSLTDKYSTPLQIENFQGSTEYASLKVKKDSMRTAALSNIYIFDLKKTEVQGELTVGDLFMIGNYDMVNKGFKIVFNPYSFKGDSFNDYFSTIIPKVINRVNFESIPFTKIEEKASTLTTSKASITTGGGYNLLFIPTDKIVGGRIEEAGENLMIEFIFTLDEGIRTSGDDAIFDYVRAKDCKVILYNAATAEILFSKLYKKQAPVSTQPTTNKQVTTTPVKK